jgi:hypothetical protein
MKSPIPENALPYNTTPRPRPTKWLGWLTAPKDFQGFYTPFWPLLIVFLSFIVSLVYEVSLLRYRTIELRTQNLHLTDEAKRADTQLTFTQGLHTDLQALEPSHPVADQLLKEFFPESSGALDEPPKTPDSTAK